MPAKPQPELREAPPVEKEIREAIAAFRKDIDREENFQFLVKQFYRPVLRFLARWSLTEQDRLDITQEVFLRVYKGLKDYRGDSQFSTWVFRIAHNTCMRWFSRSPGGSESYSLQREELDDDELTGRAALLLGDQLEELITREKYELLRKAIADLPGQMRRCVELHIYQDLRYHEVAAVLRLSTGTVKAQLFQAREKLRDRLIGSLAGENL
jgi:RNA polymerase sigma-70 factor (ECF subfamily)